MISYRQDIDGLRCLAVLLVVLFHVQLWPLTGGYIGVDVFFVISGFLVTSVITSSMERGRFKFSDFYARRIRRLFPAVFVTVVLSMIAGWILFPPDAFSDLAQSSIATLLSGSNIYFWATSGYFETAAHYKPLLHTWSLAIEEQFYLVWPLAIVVIAGAAVKRNRLIIALIVAVIASTLLAEWAIRSNHMTAAFFMLPFRINEFAIGALVAFLPAWKSRVGNNGLAIVGLVGMIVPAFLFTSETVFPGINAMIPCLATAALIYAGRETLTAKVLSNPVMTYVGRMSYSFYLAHWPIIAFYLFWRGSAVGLEPIEQAALFVASFALGAAMYHFVEVPFRLARGTAKIAPNLDNNGVGLWFTGSTLAVVVASAYIWGQQGIPSRYDDNQEIAQLLASMDALTREEKIERESAMVGPDKVLLIGDSHAGVTYPAYMKWGAENGNIVERIHVPGCIPLLNVNSTRSEKDKDKCIERNFTTLGGIEADEYKLIIMHARWGLYTSNSTELGNRFGKIVAPILTNEQTSYQDVALARSRFESSLKETVNRFDSIGVPIVFVGQVPHVGESQKACVAQSNSLRDVEQNCRSVTYEQIMSETAWATEHAKTVPDLIVYDPTDAFCPNENCMFVHDGLALYVDADHLSSAGAEYLMEGLGPVLNKAMAGQ